MIYEVMLRLPEDLRNFSFRKKQMLKTPSHLDSRYIIRSKDYWVKY